MSGGGNNRQQAGQQSVQQQPLFPTGGGQNQNPFAITFQHPYQPGMFNFTGNGNNPAMNTSLNTAMPLNSNMKQTTQLFSPGMNPLFNTLNGLRRR